MKRVPVHHLDPAGGSTGQTLVISGGKFVLGSATTDPEVVRDIIGAALVAGAGVTITVDDPGDHITITATASGEILMADGVTGPPVPIENEARSDWLYQG